MGKSRISELDGLRGVAAAAVFCCHAVPLAPFSSPLRQVLMSPVLACFYTGTAPVFLFFVLSGFVLSLPFLEGDRSLSYPRFLIQRAFRIYPALWVTILAAIGGSYLYAPDRLVGLAPWAHAFWGGSALAHSPSALLRMALLIPPFPQGFDPPSWSLGPEMRMSLLLPAVIWLLRQRVSPGFSLLILIASYFLAAWHLFFLPMFVMGACVAKHRTALVELAARLGPLTTLAVAVGAAALWANYYIHHDHWMTWLAAQLVAIPSAVLIVAAMARPGLRTLLRSRPVHGLGRLSYGFYLLHFPTLAIGLGWLVPVIGFWLAMVACAAMTLLESMLMFRLVERPFIRLGHGIAPEFA